MRTLVCALALITAAAHASAQTPEQSPRASPDSPAPTCVLRDTLGNVRRADEEAMLDNFAAALASEPQTTAHIIAYGGRRGPRGDARARLARMRRYLVGKRGVAAGRIVTLDGGYREEAAAELWAVPAGSTPPAPTPIIDPSEVEFTAQKPRRGRRNQARARTSSRSE